MHSCGATRLLIPMFIDEIGIDILDAVQPGESQAETDHHLQGKSTESGEFAGRKWRHATKGGWFSYQLKVLPGEPMSLLCTYASTDAGRSFDIQVDGQKLATQALDGTKPGQFFDETYSIPADLTAGKKTITLRFQAPRQGFAGGVFDCRMMKQK